MTVDELIRILERLPGTARVCVHCTPLRSDDIKYLPASDDVIIGGDQQEHTA